MDLSIYVTSSLTSSERRISPQWDLSYLKTRLEAITGIPPCDQTLLHYPSASSDKVTVISDGQKYSAAADQAVRVLELKLAPYSRLHVTDKTGKTDFAADGDDQEEGFQLSEEDYAKRTDTVLNWKRENQLGRFDPGLEAQRQQQQQKDAALVAGMKVGNRCRVIGIQGERRGVIRHIGAINALDEGQGMWVGVEFDEPVGKNNGNIGDVQVFQCRPKHGSFLRPKQVEVGDFPEEEFSDDEI